MHRELERLLGKRVCVIVQVNESCTDVYGVLEGHIGYYQVDAVDGLARFYASDVATVNLKDRVITIEGATDG
jgi:hypothetical protein